MEKGFTKPERHIKGWGYEDWIVNNERYCGKILHFEKGKKCSIHYHKIKDETFYLARGEMEILLSDSVDDFHCGNFLNVKMHKGESLYIWPGRVHQMVALGECDLYEFSTMHNEEDSYRIVRGD